MQLFAHARGSQKRRGKGDGNRNEYWAHEPPEKKWTGTPYGLNRQNGKGNKKPGNQILD
jgi:hypothetical protein